MPEPESETGVRIAQRMVLIAAGGLAVVGWLAGATGILPEGVVGLGGTASNVADHDQFSAAEGPVRDGNGLELAATGGGRHVFLGDRATGGPRAKPGSTSEKPCQLSA